MIRSTMYALTLTAFALAVPARAEDKMTAEAVLKKAMDAAGGEATLKKYVGVREKGTGIIDLNGVEAAFSVDSLQAAEKIKVAFTVEFGGMKIKALQIVNGDKIRMSVNGMEVPLEDNQKTEMREMLQLRKINMIYPLLDGKSFDVKLLDGMQKVADSDAFVLAVKSRDLRELKAFFDSKSFLMVKVEKIGLDGAQKEGKQEMFLTGYKKADGLMVPTKSRVLHDGKKFMEMDTTETKMLEKVEASEFDVSD